MANTKIRRILAAVIIYLALGASVLGFNVMRARTAAPRPTQPAAAAATPTPTVSVSSAQPYFSLTTNRSYSPNESARLWASYQNIEYLDFRVYRIKDPNKFFKQLDDPHEMGEKEKEQISQGYGASPSLLDRTHRFKTSLFAVVKDYVRTHLLKTHRETFNQKYRKEPPAERTPLNVADYARVPLLNPDQKVKDWREQLPALENEYDSRMIPLGKLDSGVYLIEGVSGGMRAYSIAIVTNLTMIEKTNRHGQVMVYIVDRKTGAPHEGVSVEVTNAKNTLSTGQTDKSGIFKTDVKVPEKPQTAEEDVDPEETKSNPFLIMARERDNFVISDVDSFYFGGYSGGDDVLTGEDVTSYIYTDRPIYRPAQSVFFKGILRQWTTAGYKLIDSKTVNVTIEDPNNGKVFEKELPLSNRGTFSGQLDVGDEAPLGNYSITASIGEARASGYFEVQEYKKPEFKVTVKGPQQFAAVGEKVRFTINANYFFGAPVTNADVHYYIYKQRYYHWWWNDSDEFDDAAGPSNEGGDDEEGEADYYDTDLVTEEDATLNARGEAYVEFEVPVPDPKEEWDYSYRLEAAVTDASRREMQGTASFIGTRGKTLADAYPERYLYYQGDPARIRVKTADYAGKPVSEKVTLKFIEQTWEKQSKWEENNGYKYEVVDYILHERELATGEVNTDSQGDATYDYTVPSPGSIYVKAIINEAGKEIVNRGGSFWASDKKGQWSDFTYQDYDDKSIKLVPDKKSYQPGQTAHVLAMLPTDQAHLLVTTELSEVLSVRHIDVTGRSIVIDVPIEKNYAPNVYLDVSFVKNSDMYNQSQILGVPARDKMLKLDIVPNKAEFKPRDVASYTVVARNDDGSPAANTEVSLGIVDESIYSIAPEAAGNIKREFYGRRYNEVQTSLAIHYTFTGYGGEKHADLAKNKSAYQLADFKNESSYAEPTIRKEFKDTAFWQPDVVTGGDGKATVSFKLPDNLTTWRATARGVTADTRVGSVVQKTIARKDVIMRLEMPRFLTEGDTVTISGLVHNFLKSDKSTKISLELNGAQLLDPADSTVTIRPNGEHRVDWRVQANTTGTLTLLAKALTDTESDAVEMTMEIVPHGLKRTTGNATTVTQNEADQTFNLDVPGRADTQARSLRIEVSPSIAGALFGALDYLTSYPYGCTEQTMSSFVPNIVVAQTLKDIPTAKIRASNDLDNKVRKGLDRLYAYQHGDGGWGWWKDDKSDPFMTAYVVDGMTMARRAGYPVDDWRHSQGREKLSALLTAGKNDNGNPIDDETRAYMIYAFTESGEGDVHFLDELYGKRNNLGPYGRALLALALQERKDARAPEVAKLIESSVQQNEFEAHWQTARVNDYGRDVYLDAEATSLSLKALSQINPGSSLLPKVARWLVQNRSNGYYWRSTKETAFAIYGLSDYLKVSKELSPEYTFEVYLNGVKVAGQSIGPSDAINAQTVTVWKKGSEIGPANQIRIVKHGKGALYVSSALEYFTADENVAAQSVGGLKITREYLRLHVTEGENGKSSWKVEPLTGELRSGDLIVARLRLSGPRAQYVMIEDPIPAGAEQVARVSEIALNASLGQWCDWYSNREFRDNRTAIFMNYFDGDATLQYAMRVEVPGEFKVAPARAELMYQPTVQANTANDRLRILDKQ
ncbi:MAG TPA: MG2 domain-containing protein [Pyrinomonadaceae bacterium]|nr:MG2 domain-containing protein [Pyrinomonadaceae bacterium]